MASFEPQDFGLEEPPPRPSTPPLRRGFVLVLVVLCLLASLVYGIPYVASEAGYAWEVGRSRAATEALARLDKAGAIDRASALFRMATTAVAPAVVNIRTQRFQPAGGGLGAPRALGQPFESVGLGSGVIIDKNKGYIVTNNHVVKDADTIAVRLSQGTDLRARLVGADPKTDLAVLQVPGPLKIAAEWGDSEKLDVGDWVLAIGSPFTLDHTVTAGIVSATQRNDLRINEYESFIQTDAAINPGNSGGPLINLNGKVIGINTAIISPDTGGVGIGLAIPSSMAKAVAEGIIKDGKVVRGYLGVQIQPVSGAIAQAFKLPDTQGSLVTNVLAGGPAAKAGLQAGDVIVKLDGKDVPDTSSLRIQTAGLSIGSTVPLTYYRDGKPGTVQVTIAEMPTASPLRAPLGFHLRELRPVESGHEDPAVVIDRIDPRSPAALARLTPGMQIVAVGRKRVRTMADYDAALAALDLSQGLPLQVVTPDGESRFVTLGGPGGPR
jgi:serine protease Do